MAFALSQLQDKLGHLSSDDDDNDDNDDDNDDENDDDNDDNGDDDNGLVSSAAGRERGGAEPGSVAQRQGAGLGQRPRKKDKVEVIEFGSVYDGKYENSKRALSAKAREEERLRRELEEQREKEKGEQSGDGEEEDEVEEGEKSGENGTAADHANAKQLPATNWSRIGALRTKRSMRAGDYDSNAAAPLIAPDGTSCSTQKTGQGVEAPLLEIGGLAATEPRPLTALMGKVDEDDVPARWERVWAALQTPVLDRLDLVSKYLDEEAEEEEEEDHRRPLCLRTTRLADS